MSSRKSQQNGSSSGLKSPATSNDLPVYPVFNFKRSEKSSGSLNNSNSSTGNAPKRKVESGGNSRPTKHRKTLPNEMSMKPITSYYQVLQNNNSDSFKVYRSRSDSSDSPTSDRDSSSKSSSTSNSSSSSSSSSSSLNDNNLNEDEESSSGAANCEADSSLEEGRSRKKSKKSHKN